MRAIAAGVAEEAQATSGAVRDVAAEIGAECDTLSMELAEFLQTLGDDAAAAGGPDLRAAA